MDFPGAGGQELAQLLEDVAGAVGEDVARDVRQAGAGGGICGEGSVTSTLGLRIFSSPRN